MVSRAADLPQVIPSHYSVKHPDPGPPARITCSRAERDSDFNAKMNFLVPAWPDLKVEDCKLNNY
jgi:hypothetical protein